ncbi:serpin family protein [Nocardioides ferulae]|uniref:serpin family protein n=1 Tax=Nocardioides ferulae TaxID=2340821 RepID=UPI000EB557CF|nr:serpin family protein [Nocardioides ferulae]
MPTRRDVLRLVPLAALAVAAPSLLSGCSDDDPSPTEPGGDLDLVASDVERSEGLPEAVPDAVASLHALGAGLWGELGPAADANLAVSPFSIGVALGLTANGARAETLAEMQRVLAAPDLDRLNGGLNALTRHVESLAGPVQRGDGSEAELLLDSANALFGQRDTEWQQEFLDVLAREYGAGMRLVDYTLAAEQARTLINDWTAEQTHDRIEEIIPEGVLDALTRLVLVNALYLKAPWEHPFEEFNTEERPFHLAGGETLRVPTMYAGLDDAAYAGGDGWQAVRLGYAGGGLAMTVVLPDEGRLADLEAAIAGGDLPAVLAAPRPQGVDLTLPKWTFRTDAPLRTALEALGMPLAFDSERADLSGMTAEERLHLQAVLHQVFIAVDEEGTEAAAATAVVAGTTSAPPERRTVVVDRPFLFAIHDLEHGTPLFLGRVADPRG